MPRQGVEHVRIFAEVLFWVGRLEIVVCAILLVHGFAIWRWRRDALLRGLAIAWLFLFIVLSIALYPGVLSLTVRGTGYVEAHLFGGIWTTDEQALTNILLRWQNLWLPIYVPWVGVWLIGMAVLAVLSIFSKQKNMHNADISIRRIGK
ncbi:MAG: hypothetical protein HZB51_32090 [Chloroflexi bacterium]|nr:hypothetical protein [Chloroflexota bacterium]